MSFISGTQAELLYSMPASGGAVTGSTSTGTQTGELLSPQGGSTAPEYTLPSFFFPDTYGVGRSIYLQGGGTFVQGTTTQTFVLTIGLNTTAGQVAPAIKLASTGILTPFGIASLSGAWMFDLLCTCTAVGTGGTLNCIGRFQVGQGGNTAVASSQSSTYMLGGPTATAFNTSTAYFVEVFGWFGATTASQTMTMTNFLVWGLN